MPITRLARQNSAYECEACYIPERTSTKRPEASTPCDANSSVHRFLHLATALYLSRHAQPPSGAMCMQCVRYAGRAAGIPKGACVDVTWELSFERRREFDAGARRRNATLTNEEVHIREADRQRAQGPPRESLWGSGALKRASHQDWLARSADCLKCVCGRARSRRTRGYQLRNAPA
jgi:hypothetical protein